jgi:hypothetical protein
MRFGRMSVASAWSIICSMTIVPEPQTALLLLFGCGGAVEVQRQPVGILESLDGDGRRIARHEGGRQRERPTWRRGRRRPERRVQRRVQRPPQPPRLHGRFTQKHHRRRALYRNSVAHHSPGLAAALAAYPGKTPR